MKLLLDENLSYRIVPSLQNNYPGTTQVRLLGLERANDREIWEFAKTNEYVIVTKDDDFQSLLAMYGHPPRVIQLLTGNNSNESVVSALLNHRTSIVLAFEDPSIGFVEIY